MQRSVNISRIHYVNYAWQLIATSPAIMVKFIIRIIYLFLYISFHTYNTREMLSALWKRLLLSENLDDFTCGRKNCAFGLPRNIRRKYGLNRCSRTSDPFIPSAVLQQDIRGEWLLNNTCDKQTSPTQGKKSVQTILRVRNNIPRECMETYISYL